MDKNSIRTEEDICQLISTDDWMMDVLVAARALQLPDWWVCAGFIRSKVWDTLHGYVHRTPLPDVDVIYYDPMNVDETFEKSLEEKLRNLLPGAPWSVKNQARMHLINGQAPYVSSTDAMSKFPETATAMGVQLLDDNRIQLAAPWGVHDLVDLIVRPTPLFSNRNSAEARIYENRVTKKKWEQTWPLVHIVHPS
ncbi:nucleotidyltransferase family protein [Alicyclobacillus kakegawensis]|uniref:nucleotidyltransferase family protein n=1 Tax=Alicyclobacillus kakegawensis TaxID=392012 RepID=UPI00082CD62D|nr:nucleotidyltransferase family protein [Alicyclobacillus kakegawensis]